MALRLRILCFRGIDLLAINHGIGRIHDDFVVGAEPGENLDLRAKVASKSDGYELGFIVGIDSCDLQTLRTENQRAYRKNERRYVTRNLQMYFRVSSRQKLSGGVVDVHFDQQGSGSDIDRVGSANQRSLKTTSGIFAQGKVCGETGLGGD